MLGRDKRAGSSGSEALLGSGRNANSGQHLRHGLASFGDCHGGAVILERPDRPEPRSEQHFGRLDGEPSLRDRFLHDVDRARQRVDD